MMLWYWDMQKETTGLVTIVPGTVLKRAEGPMQAISI